MKNEAQCEDKWSSINRIHHANNIIALDIIIVKDYKLYTCSTTVSTKGLKEDDT